MTQPRRGGRFSVGAGLIAVMLSLVSPTAAEESNGQPGWQYQVTPYVWATGIGGDLTPFAGAETIAFEESFSDVLKDLDAALFIAASARRDRLVFAGDLTFAATSRSGVIGPGVPASGKLTQRSLTLLGGYSLVRDDKSTVDLMAGLRAWSIKASVDAAAVGVQASGSKSFVDPIIAMRGTFQVAPQWSVTLYGDFGGFGVGSQQTWQVLAAASYQMRENRFLSVGYRHMAVDYRSGGTDVDVSMSGPLVGMTWRF
jgi:hypothetical protein